MKKIVVISVALVVFFGFFPGCVNSSKQEQETEMVVGARKQHDTRVVVLCKNKKGQYLEKSLHKSESVTCGDSTFKLEDFGKVTVTDHYIAFPGQEKELENYLTEAKEPKR